MEKVEFVGSVTELSYKRPDDDDDDFCPSADTRSVACCSPGID
jgi:hypothetical protein